MSRTIRDRPHWRRSWSTALPWHLERDYCCRQECCSPKAKRRAGDIPARDRRRGGSDDGEHSQRDEGDENEDDDEQHRCGGDHDRVLPDRTFHQPGLYLSYTRGSLLEETQRLRRRPQMRTMTHDDILPREGAHYWRATLFTDNTTVDEIHDEHLTAAMACANTFEQSPNPLGKNWATVEYGKIIGGEWVLDLDTEWLTYDGAVTIERPANAVDSINVLLSGGF